MPREKTVIDRYTMYYTSRMTVEEFLEFKKNKKNIPSEMVFIKGTKEKKCTYLENEIYKNKQIYNFIFSEKDK